MYSLYLWIGFTIFILILLALDLGVFHKERRPIPVREALWMTVGYIILALIFNFGVYLFYPRREAAIEFLTGYFIEYALSMDNIMVFVLILAHFRVPQQFQMRLLVWGILGALILRALFILTGAALISTFHWVVLVFGAFLIYTGFKTMFVGESAHDLEKDRIVRFSRRLMPLTPRYDGEKFFTIENGKRFATPMFLVLVVLNLTDILFAVDSIPAIFAITQDPFIVYTSNVFAILGLRALYFALAGALDKFHLLRYGISLVLIFIGGKMIANDLVGKGFIPTQTALGVTALFIFGSILLSLIFRKPPEEANPADGKGGTREGKTADVSGTAGE